MTGVSADTARAPRIVVLAGGVGGSKFVVGVRETARRRWADTAGGTCAEITVIVNTGDDLWLSGLRLQPDVDSMIYALAGINDTERGWGRAGESERVAVELHAWGAGWPWFTLGDLDLGAHIARTGWLRDGATVTEVVDRLASRWSLGVRLLPMTDAEVDTHVTTDQGRMHFQEWWTRHRAALPAHGFDWPGIAHAEPAPGVREALAAADVILFAPSNPVVSLGPILAVPGIADAVRTASAAVVGVSPIIAGAPVRGMADACLAAVGLAATADAVGRHYGARAGGGLLDTWLLAEEDASLADGVESTGLRAPVHPLWMRDLDGAVALAAAAFDSAMLDSATLDSAAYDSAALDSATTAPFAVDSASNGLAVHDLTQKS
ncbi:2-phospho-L-lactate transferase [Microbacterium maritypicum]|uniref:2-phospho-L-lactate transferase n=1 Tax=Microbacterium maritypicum TaxID=33918 RepID=A0AAD3WZX9_MICMQ|nr:2-phospho-L-lactate transferase [Microbacterium liquefaciens]KAB1881620.1 2-phospho-L-lactate transferase [Microbacterium liquefaciens]